MHHCDIDAGSLTVLQSGYEQIRWAVPASYSLFTGNLQACRPYFLEQEVTYNIVAGPLAGISPSTCKEVISKKVQRLIAVRAAPARVEEAVPTDGTLARAGRCCG